MEALEQVLKQHRALMWMDPTTQALSVKRKSEVAGEDSGQAVASLGPAYA